MTGSLTLNPGEAFRTPAANERPLLCFRVQIKRGRDVLETFPALGTDSLAVAHNFQRLCGPGQYVRVLPIGSTS